MAIESSGNYSYVGEHTITVGSVIANSSKTVTTTVPSFIDTPHVPHVIANTLTDTGLGIGNAWFTVSNLVTTLNIKILNSTVGNVTPTNDPIVFKVVVL